MKQQTTALLLCALIFSTLAHEHWRAKEHAPPQLKHEKSNARHLTAFHSRAHEETCVEFCQSETNGTGSNNGLKVIINVELNILVLVNETANVALIFGYGENIVVVLDGGNGAIAVIDLEAGKGVYLGTILIGTTVGWKSSQQTIEQYIKELVSLRALYEKVSGTIGHLTFQVSSPNGFVQQLVHKVLTSLDNEIDINNSQAVTRLVNIAKVLNLSLKNLGKLLQNITFNLEIGGLERLSGVLRGVVTIVLRIVGILGIDIDGLVGKGVDLNLSILLNLLSNGSIFVFIVALIQAKINIDEALLQLLSLDNFFKLLADLSSKVDLYVVIYRLITVLETSNNNLNVSNAISLVEGLVVYVANVIITDTNQNKSYSETIESLYKLRNISSVAQNSNVLTDLLNNNLTVENVNINEVINLLLEIDAAGSTGRSGINIIITVLVLLQEVVSLLLIIPIFLVIIVIYLLTSAGWGILRALFPTVQALSGGISAILAAILKINLSALLHLNLYKFLTSLPIVGDILKVVGAELQKNNINLASLLNVGATLQSVVKFLVDLLTCVISLGTNHSQLCQSFKVTPNGLHGDGCDQLSGKSGLELNLSVNVELVLAFKPLATHCEKTNATSRRLHHDKHYGYVRRYHVPTHEKKH